MPEQERNRTLDFAAITSAGYWSQTRVLAESLQRHAPGSRLHTLVLDDGLELRQESEPNQVLYRIEDLGLPDVRDLSMRFNLFELSCALKPPFLLHLIENVNIEKAAYVDADLWFFDYPHIVDQRLDENAILLTPHFASVADPSRPGLENQQFRWGTYNLGFFAVRRARPAIDFLRWWGERTLRYCCEDPAAGVYTDQQWIDLVPGLFPAVVVERHPGLNVARWNLRGRPITRKEDRYSIAGEPLIFVHFTQYRPGMAVREYLWGQNFGPAVDEIYTQYAQAMLAKGYQPGSKGKRIPAQDVLPNGERIPLLCRQVLRDLNGEHRHSLRAASESPADVVHWLVKDRGEAGTRFRALAFHQAWLRRLGSAENVAHRYRTSWFYRKYVDVWFYLFGPNALRLPVEWVESGFGSRLMRRALLGPARLASWVLRRDS